MCLLTKVEFDILEFNRFRILSHKPIFVKGKLDPRKGDLMPKALVTGANGFVGSHLTEHLLKKGYQIRCLVRKTSNLRYLQALDLEYVFGDVRDKDSLRGISRGCDYVFHVAGVTRGSNAKLYFQGNSLGTKNLLEICLSENPNLKRFLYISSQAAVGPSPDSKGSNEKASCHPITPYGQSKLEAEKLVLQYRDEIPVTIIRPPAVYGPRDDELFLAFKVINYGIKPQIGWKDSFVSICYIQDLVEAVLLSAENPKSAGETYFIADDRIYSWKEATDIIAKSLKRKAILIRFPKISVFTFACIIELIAKALGKSTIMSRYKARELCQRYWVCDVSKAKADLSFIPKVNLEEGSKKTTEWYKNNGWL